MSKKIVLKRQQAIDKCAKVIESVPKKIKYCPKTLKSVVSDKDLQPFLVDKDCQKEFIRARMHWLLQDIRNRTLHGTTLLYRNMQKFENAATKQGIYVNWSHFDFPESVCQRFVIKRKPGFISFLKKDCMACDSALQNIGRNWLKYAAQYDEDRRADAMKLCLLHQQHNLPLLLMSNTELGVPEIRTKYNIKVHQTYYRFMPFGAWFTFMKVMNPLKMSKIMKTQRACTIAICDDRDCLVHLAETFGQYYHFFTTIVQYVFQINI